MRTIVITIKVDETYVRANMNAEREGSKSLRRQNRSVNYRATDHCPDLAVEIWAAVRRECDYWRAQPDIWSA